MKSYDLFLKNVHGMAPEVGFEPTTNRLTADRSTTELLWIISRPIERLEFCAAESVRQVIWLRGLDLNQRPSGYEPDELPGCSTPRIEISCDVDPAQIETIEERLPFMADAPSLMRD